MVERCTLLCSPLPPNREKADDMIDRRSCDRTRSGRTSSHAVTRYEAISVAFTTVAIPSDARLLRAASIRRSATAPAPWAGSHQLLQLAGHRFASSPAGNDGCRRRAAIAAMPMALALLEVAASDALRRADELLARSMECSRTDARHLAAFADRILRDALRDTARLLGADERRLITTTSIRALSVMGFGCSRVDGPTCSTVSAARRGQAVALRVDDRGVLTADVTGCGGTSRPPLIADLQRNLAGAGTVVDWAAIESRPCGRRVRPCQELRR